MATFNRDVVALLDDALYLKLDDALQVRGWRMHRARRVEDVVPLLDERVFHVGLLQVQRIGEQKLLDLVERPALQWIALMDHAFWHPGPQHRNFLAGAYDFHTLPADIDRLVIALGHAWGKGKLLHPTPESGPETLEAYGIVGRSAAMLKFGEALRKASKPDAPVLISGESGTGKELAAHAIHALSARSKHPFIAVNCGALPQHLIQSELFGHEKGAFTGAHQRKIGRIEAAQGGTLFLDEIADLPLGLQANLLRVLQDKVIERLGSTQRIQLDIRVVAASHVDLRDAVAQGQFREDLYYRLNVINLVVPPLRERQGDIELLAQALLDRFTRDTLGRVKGFSQQALRAMNQYAWPGNVREMINRIRQGVVMAEHAYLTPEDLGMERRTRLPGRLTLDGARMKAEVDAIRSALRRCQHNVSETARELGVSRATLYRLLERHGLTGPTLRGLNTTLDPGEIRAPSAPAQPACGPRVA